jgi:hypothetical protein
MIKKVFRWVGIVLCPWMALGVITYLVTGSRWKTILLVLMSLCISVFLLYGLYGELKTEISIRNDQIFELNRELEHDSVLIEELRGRLNEN